MATEPGLVPLFTFRWSLSRPIRQLIALAVQDTPDQTFEWVRLAKEAKLDAPDVATIIRLVPTTEDLRPGRRIPHGARARSLRSKLEAMNELMEEARFVRQDLADRLTDSDAPD